MKRLISLLILAMLAMSVMTSTALAGGDESNRAFGFTAYTDGSTLNHNPNRFQWKDGNENFIEVRHEVTGNGSGAVSYTHLDVYKRQICKCAHQHQQHTAQHNMGTYRGKRKGHLFSLPGQ